MSATAATYWPFFVTLTLKDTAGINSTDFHFPGLTSLAALPGLLVMKPWPIISDC